MITKWYLMIEHSIWAYIQVYQVCYSFTSDFIHMICIATEVFKECHFCDSRCLPWAFHGAFFNRKFWGDQNLWIFGFWRIIPLNVVTHDGSMVLLYMVLHGSHQKKTVMCHVSINIPAPWILWVLLIYQHHGSIFDRLTIYFYGPSIPWLS